LSENPELADGNGGIGCPMNNSAAPTGRNASAATVAPAIAVAATTISMPVRFMIFIVSVLYRTNGLHNMAWRVQHNTMMLRPKNGKSIDCGN
jgi:hypothetical protein